MGFVGIGGDSSSSTVGMNSALDINECDGTLNTSSQPSSFSILRCKSISSPTHASLLLIIYASVSLPLLKRVTTVTFYHASI